MSSALPPIVPASPPASRAPVFEDVTEPGAFERALGLATTLQASPAPIPSAPLPMVADEACPPALPDADAGEAALTSVAPSGTGRSAPAQPLPLMRRLHDLTRSHASEDRPMVGTSTRPIASPAGPVTIPGSPLPIAALPEVESHRSTAARPGEPIPPVAADAPVRAIARATPDGSASPQPAAAVLPGPAVPRDPPAQASAVRLEPVPSVAAAHASAQPPAAFATAAAVALPAAVALDVRVITSRIAPALRRGGLLDPGATTQPHPTSASSRPGLALGLETVPSVARGTTPQPIQAAMPAATTGLAPGAMTTGSAISRSARSSPTTLASTAAGLPLESALTIAEAPLESAPPVLDSDEPSARGLRRMQAPVPVHETPPPAMHAVRATAAGPPLPQAVAASPRPRAVLDAATPVADAPRRAPEPPAAHVHTVPAQAAPVGPPQDQRPSLHNEQADRSHAAAPAAESASATALPEAVTPTVDAPRQPRGASVGSAQQPTQEASTLDRAEAASQARLGPARRAADQVTLRFEGEGGIEGRLRVSVRGDQVHARLLGMDAQSMERFAPELRQLQRALEDQGFRDPRVSMQDLRALPGPNEARTDARAQDERRQSESGRRQSPEERGGESGPDGQRDRRRTRDGRHGS